MTSRRKPGAALLLTLNSRLAALEIDRRAKNLFARQLWGDFADFRCPVDASGWFV